MKQLINQFCYNHYDMWGVLNIKDNQRAKENIAHLQENDNISMYISTNSALGKKVNDLRESINDRQLLTKIKVRLPPNYEPFVTSLEQCTYCKVDNEILSIF
jgi:hypothetical protein